MGREGDVASDTPVSVRVASDLLNRLDAIAGLMDRSRSYVIVRAVEAFVEAEERRQREIAEGFADIERGRSIPWDDAVSTDLRRFAEQIDETENRSLRHSRGDEAAE